MASTPTFPIRFGTGLVEITLARPQWVRLSPFPVRMSRLIVSAENQSGLVAAVNLSAPGSDEPGP